ncbi:MAG TPA: DinB family protein [Edaphocola sp.]|nr:DinB family protein [Edaphocola sp.]
MSNKQNLLVELERETASTKKMLAALNDNVLDYKPHEKSMSMGSLAAHIVNLNNWISVGLGKDSLDLITDLPAITDRSVEGLQNALDDSFQKAVDQIYKMEDEDWTTEWTLKAGDRIILKMPKIAIFRFMIQNHMIHHRGQLSVYLRMNDIPVPGMYGPSADEK